MALAFLNSRLPCSAISDDFGLRADMNGRAVIVRNGAKVLGEIALQRTRKQGDLAAGRGELPLRRHVSIVEPAAKTAHAGAGRISGELPNQASSKTTSGLMRRALARMSAFSLSEVASACFARNFLIWLFRFRRRAISRARSVRPIFLSCGVCLARVAKRGRITRLRLKSISAGDAILLP